MKNENNYFEGITLTCRLDDQDKAELFWNEGVETRVNTYFVEGYYHKVDKEFIGYPDEIPEGANLSYYVPIQQCHLYKVCKHYFVSNIKRYASLQYWSVDEYFQYCMINYLYTMYTYKDNLLLDPNNNSKQYTSKYYGKKQNDVKDITALHKAYTLSDGPFDSALYYVNVDELNFYSSILAHCKYILLSYVRKMGGDKYKANVNLQGNTLEHTSDTTTENTGTANTAPTDTGTANTGTADTGNVYEFNEVRKTGSANTTLSGKQFYNIYKEWCKETDKTPVSSTKFGRDIKKLNPNFNITRPHNITTYNNIVIKEEWLSLQ